MNLTKGVPTYYTRQEERTFAFAYIIDQLEFSLKLLNIYILFNWIWVFELVVGCWLVGNLILLDAINTLCTTIFEYNFPIKILL